MRKQILFYSALLMLAASSFTLQAQTAKEVFDASTFIAYYGIDFTRLKIIDDGESNVYDIVDNQLDAFNDLIVKEPKKYPLALAIQRPSISNNLGPVAKRNHTLFPDDIRSVNALDFYRLKESDIQAVVTAFDFGTYKGIALLVVGEAFSKSKKAGAFWFTFVNTNTKKVLFTERVEGLVGGKPPASTKEPRSPRTPKESSKAPAKGASWRNYWAGTFKSAIEDVKKTKYNEWRSKYGR